MDTLHHGMNLNLHNVLSVTARRDSKGIIHVHVKHGVRNCSAGQDGVAEFEMYLYPAEGGILYGNCQDDAC